MVSTTILFLEKGKQISKSPFLEEDTIEWQKKIISNCIMKHNLDAEFIQIYL